MIGRGGKMISEFEKCVELGEDFAIERSLAFCGGWWVALNENPVMSLVFFSERFRASRTKFM